MSPGTKARRRVSIWSRLGSARGPGGGRGQGGPTARPPGTEGASRSCPFSSLFPSVICRWYREGLCCVPCRAQASHPVPGLELAERHVCRLELPCRHTVTLLVPSRPRGAAVLPEPDCRDPAGRSLVAPHRRPLHQQARPQGLRALVRGGVVPLTRLCRKTSSHSPGRWWRQVTGLATQEPVTLNVATG